MRDIFRYQFWHLLSLVILLGLISYTVDIDPGILAGTLWGCDTAFWLWLAITVPILHQLYVWLIWRLELYKNIFTEHFSVSLAFRLYAAGFSVLFVSRLIFISILAISNRNSLEIEPLVAYLLITIITPLVVYLFYSVKKYFTIERAYGIDHFDKAYNIPYVQGGIFKYTDNGMYIVGLMTFYLPGLILFSKAALLVALFNHVYIWVHFYTTERPDMLKIYGKVP